MDKASVSTVGAAARKRALLPACYSAPHARCNLPMTARSSTNAARMCCPTWTNCRGCSSCFAATPCAVACAWIMSTGIARYAVIPRLPELLQQDPLLELEFSSTERRVDLIREGFDCVLRAGAVVDPGLVGRTISHMPMCNCASPAYLARLGIPRTPIDLVGHRLVHYAHTLGSKPDGFDYVDGTQTSHRAHGPMRSQSTTPKPTRQLACQGWASFWCLKPGCVDC